MDGIARDLSERLEDEKKRWQDEEPDRFGTFAIAVSDHPPRVELLRSDDPHVDLAGALLEEATRLNSYPDIGWVPMRILTIGVLETMKAGLAMPIEFCLEGRERVKLRFVDGSEHILPAPPRQVQLAGGSGSASSGTGTLTVSHSTDALLVANDHGEALLKPITIDEFGSIELLIGELYRAHALERIQAHEARKILELAELLKDVARETIPGETPRWRPIGAIRAVLRTLFQAPFRDALALSQIVEILANVKWHELAHEFQQLLP